MSDDFENRTSPDGDLVDPALLVTLTKCASLIDADAIRCRLENEGIPCVLPDEALMQNITSDASTYGFVRVQVRDQDYERAREVLNAHAQAHGDSEEDATPGRALVPLPFWMKCTMFCLAFTTVSGFIILLRTTSSFSRQGCDRKARQAAWSFMAGVILLVVGGIVFVLLH